MAAAHIQISAAHRPHTVQRESFMKSILGESMTPAARSNGDPRFELANQAACTDWETWVIWECTDRPYHVTSTRPGDRRVKAVAGAV